MSPSQRTTAARRRKERSAQQTHWEEMQQQVRNTAALATVFIALLREHAPLVTSIGSCAAGLTEILAASNRLYNQASQQFANCQM